MREKPSSFECNGEPKTCDLNAKLIATISLGSSMCYALSFGCIDDAGIEEVLEMHLEAVSPVSRSISYSSTIKELLEAAGKTNPQIRSEGIPWLLYLFPQASCLAFVVSAPDLHR
jgi:hypothetical protein